jgi:hypothetical protein
MTALLQKRAAEISEAVKRVGWQYNYKVLPVELSDIVKAVGWHYV